MIGALVYGVGLVALGVFVVATAARERGWSKGYREAWDEHDEREEREREREREERLAKLEEHAPIVDLTGRKRVTIEEAEAIARGAPPEPPRGTSFVRAIRFEVPFSALQQQAEQDLDDDDADELDDDGDELADDDQGDDLDH